MALTMFHQKALTSAKDESKDLDSNYLLDEMKSFQVLVDNDGEKSPLEFLNAIHKFGLKPIYPNLTAALKIFLSLPVTTAAAESSFSKLKIIKNINGPRAIEQFGYTFN